MITVLASGPWKPLADGDRVLIVANSGSPHRVVAAQKGAR